MNRHLYINAVDRGHAVFQEFAKNGYALIEDKYMPAGFGLMENDEYIAHFDLVRGTVMYTRNNTGYGCAREAPKLFPVEDLLRFR